VADESSKVASEEVSRVLAQINSLWIEGRPSELAPLFHEDIVMAHPGFSGVSKGKTLMLAGFEDFCAHASLHSFDVTDRSVDVVGDVAVATFRFDIVFERDGKKYHSTGRDLWVFKSNDGSWQAVWRTMLDTTDEEAS
jgi:ketosteroid isomerase-like protein